ncbi:alpha/beta hydrolase [Ferrimonas balearica]|uniref:alpha/beta hydrolase n=1 Tax=Ferrimonas balearica TaxID=44012 RepID=UPI001C991394|nr:alpha/beta hydrolase [Ferrimonas balearica]MBY5993157.1 alpha/beta hydrolase [Ferrimonas balearica]
MFRLILLLLALPGLALAQTQPLPQVSAGTLVRLTDFPSEQVPPRHIEVWTPSGFPPGQRFEVLYMHDGQMLFDAETTWNGQEWRVDEVASALMAEGQVRPFMVVGIWNAGAQRHNEYFPQAPFETLPEPTQRQFLALERHPGQPLFGGPLHSDAYLRFLLEELAPHIEGHFPAKPGAENRYLMGSSMGGLISWYGLLRHPEAFAGAAALSTHWPGIMTADNPAPAALRAYIAQRLPLLTGQKLYFDYGDQTLDALYPPLQAQVDPLFANYPKGLWTSRFFPGAAHTESDWAERLDQPLRFLFGTQ